MKMYFRTFTGYMKEGDAAKLNMPQIVRPNHPKDEYDLKTPGSEIVYSTTRGYNRFCRCRGCCYEEKPLHLSSLWRDIFFKAAEFACEYPEVGFVTFYDDKNDSSSILMECTDFRAYLECSDVNSFLVFFNVRPSLVNSFKNNVIVGRDHYSFNYEPGSMIVWDLDKYAYLDLGDYTVWGIRHNVDGGTSCTGDELVGLHKGNLLRVTQYDRF